MHEVLAATVKGKGCIMYVVYCELFLYPIYLSILCTFKIVKRVYKVFFLSYDRSYIIDIYSFASDSVIQLEALVGSAPQHPCSSR